jgi:hypothetical protein
VLGKIRASNLLDRGSIERRHREIVILRTTRAAAASTSGACTCAFFAAKVGLGGAEVAATVHGGQRDPVWSVAGRTLMRLVDELHDTSRVSDALWEELRGCWNGRPARRARRARGLLPHDLVRR